MRASSDVVYRMNADWTEMHHLDGREFISDTLEPSRSWLEKYIHPHDRAIVVQQISAAIRAKRVFDYEHRVIRVDGSIGWTHSRAAPVLDASGEIVEWVGMATDITARKKEQDDLARQRQLYEAILTNTPDLAYVWDLEHRFIYANEVLLKMWGRTWDEAIGRHCLELGYEPWHAQMHDREIDQVVATKAAVRGDVPFDGTFGRRMYEYLLVPVLGPDGEVTAVAGTTRDVTERQQLERSLLEADRRKDEFLATLAHELRNPLAPIRNAVQLLKLVNPVDQQVCKARDIIDRQVGHMVRLVDDLMEVSRITLGKIVLRQERVSLRSVLSDAVESVAPLVESAGQTLAAELPDNALETEGDATRLSQIFHNLLDNASKYTPRGGCITVKVERLPAEVCIRVADTGIGISAEWQARVFELFTRVQGRDQSKSTGLGIGLALSRQLVALHGGRMEMHSEGVGKGSEFTVYLPLAGCAAAQPAPRATVEKPPSSGARPRVLVVDDNRDAAESLEALLQVSGCQVRAVFDGPTALEAFDSFHPDIVLLDIGLPDMDGYEVARRIRSSERGARVDLIALTGWGQPQDQERALAAGFDRHFTKPLDPDLLGTIVPNRSRARAESSG